MLSDFDQLKRRTSDLFKENPIEEHPFIQTIKKEQFTHAQVKYISLQMYHVVHHFPRFLAAILTQMPDYMLRMPLVENLYEEHGKMNPKYVHVETYKQFLTGVGIQQGEIDQSEPSIPVVAYNRAVIDLCLHHPVEEGLAALGVIEEIVARVSPIIAHYLQGSYPDSNHLLVHFTDHEILDIAHADEIYEVASHFYHDERKKGVERGLQLGWYYHRRLYTDLLERIKRGERIEVSGGDGS